MNPCSIVTGSLLDVGCGSGILAIAAGKLGAGELLGVDTDPIAVEATAANARLNGQTRKIRVRQGSVPSGEGPFDLVLANLIASLLVMLAAPLRAELKPGGRILASGIFRDREGDVRAAARGRRLAHHADLEGRAPTPGKGEGEAEDQYYRHEQIPDERRPVAEELEVPRDE